MRMAINSFPYLSLAFCLILSCQPKHDTEDPYLWLENLEGERSMEWVDSMNLITEGQILNSDFYEKFYNALRSAASDDDVTPYPNVLAEYVYNINRDSIHQRGIWRRIPVEDFNEKRENWEILLDIDSLATLDNVNWVYKGVTFLRPNYDRCLLRLAPEGKDEFVVKEFDLTTKSFVENGFNAPVSKGNIGWMDDNTVVAMRDFGQNTMTESGYPRMMKMWKRGTDLNSSPTLMEVEKDHVGLFGFTSYRYGKYRLFLHDWSSYTDHETLLFVDGELKSINKPVDARISSIYGDRAILELKSDWSVDSTTFAKGSLVSYDYQNFLTTGEQEVELLFDPDERSSFISSVAFDSFLVFKTLENIQNRMYICHIKNDKWDVKSLNAPTLGIIDIKSSTPNTGQYYYDFSNAITPAQLFYCIEDSCRLVRESKKYFEPEDVSFEQHEAVSKDGTRIPYFVAMPKAMKLDGTNPTVIDAYGGFGTPKLPQYLGVIGKDWLSKGGAYVIANIRGGGEFGPEWHEAGTREKRQNAYDDLFAVTEDLIARKITSPEKLGFYGWSNGGLLAGVALTQRPDLFSAIVAGAPILDMRRYSKLLAGPSWIAEYGDPDVPEDWEFMKKYSPYHNISPDTNYPEVLFVTSTADDRVHPGHARKMAAKMKDQGHHVLFYETKEGGHGAASTIDQQAALNAMMLAFMHNQLMPANKPIPD